MLALAPCWAGLHGKQSLSLTTSLYLLRLKADFFSDHGCSLRLLSIHAYVAAHRRESVRHSPLSPRQRLGSVIYSLTELAIGPACQRLSSLTEHSSVSLCRQPVRLSPNVKD